MIDERMIELLDRKYEFVAEVDDQRLLLEAARLAQWLFEEDLVRPYALQLLDEDREQRARFAEHRARARAEAIRLRNEVERIYPEALTTESAIADPSLEFTNSLRRFDGLTASTRERRGRRAEIWSANSERDQTIAGALLGILSVKERELRRGKDESEDKDRLRAAIVGARKLHEVSVQGAQPTPTDSLTRQVAEDPAVVSPRPQPASRRG